MDHIPITPIFGTPERLQAAASKRSADDPHRPSRFSSHLLAVPGAISITFMSPRPSALAAGDNKRFSSTSPPFHGNSLA
jgi:hypothetical protein